MFSTRTITASLIAVVLLLPSCATDRQNQTTPATDQHLTSSTEQITIPTGVHKSVVQVASHEEPHDTAVRPAPILPENLALPEPVNETGGEPDLLSLDALE